MSNKTSKSILHFLLDNVERISLSKQILYGALSGWIASYGLMKVGKAAALIIGSGIVLIEIASDSGYIDINWNKINMRIEEAAENSNQANDRYWVDIIENCIDATDIAHRDEFNGNKSIQRRDDRSTVRQTKKSNTVLLSSVFAGVLIGIGTS
ncbi:hypothetical protein RI129_002685 [Pyrocoelia pectoralis]|uniref:Uncharacterized protein n=1 Tax=Pyrocoelia pectoralis TaxID=417401 RepID=A0AAN7VNF6_9COLE